MKRASATETRRGAHVVDLSKLKRRAAGAAIGVAAAVSLALSSLFGSPAEVLPPEPAAIVSVAEDEATDTQTTDDKTRRGARVRAWIVRLPVAVRVFVVLPLWFFGEVLTLVLTGLWRVASPLWSSLAGVLFTLLLVVGAAVLIFRLLYPDRPLKDLFRKRNIAVMVACALALTLCDRLLPLVWDAYDTVSVWIKAAVTLLVPLGLILLLWKRRRDRATAAVSHVRVR